MKRVVLLLFFLVVVLGQIMAQRTITGQVTDENNDPMPGVNITLKGTTRGVITDTEGNYTITEVPDDGVLVFSFIGMMPQEISVTDQTSINVTLAEDLMGLEEVVVIGYGMVKKRDLTGSVSSVKSEDITKIPTHNAMEAIQGRVPGMDITRSSGSAGSGVYIRLRGNRSINATNEPLFIIDGVQGGSVSDLSPGDIASIEVLKDASSTAIYGYQGANGVIIVTTKKGTTGRPRVSYNAYYGINGFTSYPQVRMRDDYINLRMEAARNGNNSWIDSIHGPEDIDILFPDQFIQQAIDSGYWVNWPDLVIQNGIQKSHQLSVSSGSEKTNTYFSVGYFKEEGVMKMDDMTRYTARLNLDHKVTKWANAGIMSQITYFDQNRRKDPLSKAIGGAPLGVVYNEDGTINTDPLGSGTSLNPLTDERPNIATDNTLRTKVFAKGYFEIIPLEGLSLRTNLGVNLDNQRRGRYNDGTSLQQFDIGISSSSINSKAARNYNWDNILNYSKTIGAHNITLTALTSYNDNAYDDVTGSGDTQTNASSLFYLIQSNENISVSSSYEEYRTFSYAGRINYDYNGKYYLTLTNRYDGASMLSGKKVDDFPSAAVAWRVSEENFLKPIETISNLKLRLSYGVTGNSSVDPYDTQSGIRPFNTSFGEVPAIGYRFNDLIGNQDLGWEKSKMYDIGLDIGLYKNRLNVTIDVYDTKTEDILFERDLPSLAGVSKVWQNIAKTRNTGFELYINSYNIKTKDFTWTTTLTYSQNEERIVELIEGVDIISNEENSLLIGLPINCFYTYSKEGIWQLGEEELATNFNSANYEFEPGDIKLADLNRDGIIDENDRGGIGSTSPKWIGGIQNTFNYKSIELGIYLVARYGQMIDAEFLGRYDPSGSKNAPAYLDYWTPQNPSNDFPRPAWGEPLYNYFGYQALTYVDGSYIKLKNISLGYTLPQELTRRIMIERLKVYSTVSNLLTFTRSDLIKEYDPERGGSEKSPLNKQLVFGVNVEF